MSKMAKRIVVVLIAALMFFSHALTAVEAKGRGGRRPQPTPEPTVEPTIDEELIIEGEVPEEEAAPVEEEAPVEETIEETAEEIVPEEEVIPAEEPVEEAVELQAEETEPELEYVDFQPGNTAVLNAVGDQAPATSKKLHDNGDGTYTLSLSVTGASESSSQTSVAKSNVILVIDTSGSMANNYAYGRVTRMAATIEASQALVTELLKNNQPAGTVSEDGTRLDDIIEISVITFAGASNDRYNGYLDTLVSQSTDETYINNRIGNISAVGGTNWEMALRQANTEAQKYASQTGESTSIIFLTDGKPTLYGRNDSGSGQEGNSNVRTCWNESTDEANALVNNGYTLYNIFAFGTDEGTDSGSNYLKALTNYAYTGSGTYSNYNDTEYTGKYFFDASDTEALTAAFNTIIDQINNKVGYTNVEMKDEVTALTSSSVSADVSGDVTGVKYHRSGGTYGAADPENGNYGQEWADAPAAKIVNGKVDWDLDDLILEDGVTYTITFVVWPSQASLDLVADLNNGKRPYASLSEAEKASVVDNGGVYTLKTNTDYPTVTYSTITTTTSASGTETHTSDPVTVDIKNPDPVGLLGQKITVEKKWDDSLDPSQRDEVAGSVVLDLYKGTDVYINDISLNEANNWKLENYVSIAPGIMITKDSPAYKDGLASVVYSGTTYYILEEGHDYKFAEDDINNHFELTAYEYHPMIIGNKVFNVTFEKDAAGKITGVKDVTEISTISATNTLKGGINLSKKVVDEDGNAVDTTDTFKMTMHLQDEEGKPYAYDYRIYYGTNNPAYATSGDQHRSEHIYGTGDAEVELYLGDTVRFVNVDGGTRYYVTEDLTNSTYELKGITYQISTGNAENYANYKEEDTVKVGDVTWYTVKGNSSSNVVVTNTHPGFFYVYHSSDNTIERIGLSDARIVDGKFNIVNETKAGYLYGGYYHAYAGQILDDAGIKSLAYTNTDDKEYEYTKKTATSRFWAADTGAAPYTGAKATAWKKVNAYTANGKTMQPVEGTVYYLKEVPQYYLRPYIQLVYDERADNLIKKLYKITAVDDANYTEVGFYDGAKDDSSKKLAASIRITNEAYPSKNVTLNAKKAFAKYNVPRGYLTSIQSGFDSDFDMQPYFKTLDGVKVYGITNRTVKPGNKKYDRAGGIVTSDLENKKMYE